MPTTPPCALTMDRNYHFTISRFGRGWGNKEDMLMTNFTRLDDRNFAIKEAAAQTG